MKRAEVTEFVADPAVPDKVYDADYLGSISTDGRIVAVFILDNGDLKQIELDLPGAISKGDFKFL